MPHRPVKAITLLSLSESSSMSLAFVSSNDMGLHRFRFVMGFSHFCLDAAVMGEQAGHEFIENLTNVIVHIKVHTGTHPEGRFPRIPAQFC